MQHENIAGTKIAVHGRGRCIPKYWSTVCSLDFLTLAMSLEQELAGALAAAKAGGDVLPFMQTIHDARGMAFRPLPVDMLAILQSSQDYASVPVGAGPVHMQIESDSGHATLILYRSRHSGLLYVLSPDSG